MPHTTGVFVLLFLALIGGIVVGLLRGGTLDALGRISVRRPWLFAVMIVALVLGRVVPGLYATGWVVATVAVALFAAANTRLPGLSLLLAGVALNAAVIVGNGGHMPVSLWGLNRAGVSSGTTLSSHQYTVAGSSTVLRPATDVIPLALPVYPAVISVGDVLIASGLGLFGAVAPVRARRTLTARRRARGSGRFRPGSVQL